MQCLHAYFAKALQHPVFRKRKSEGTAGRNRVDPLGEHWEIWNVRGVDCETPCDLTQIQSHYRTDPSWVWRAHALHLTEHRACEGQPEDQRRSLIRAVKSLTKNPHNFELWSHFNESRIPKQREGCVPLKLQRQGERQTIWGLMQRPLCSGCSRHAGRAVS